MEIYYIVSIIGFFISIIVLFEFFKVSGQISLIKKAILKDNYDYSYALFNKYMYFGEKTKAKEALQDAIWAKINDNKDSLKQRQRSYEDLKAKHEKTLIDLGGTYPAKPF